MTPTSFSKDIELLDVSPPDPEKPALNLDQDSTRRKQKSVDVETLSSKFPKPITPNMEYESVSSRNGSEKLRVACAELYEQASQDFIQRPTLDSLEQLNYALAKVHAEDVDSISAEKVLSCSQAFLKNEDVRSILLACQLIVRYDLKRAEAPTSYFVSDSELCTTKFRQVSNKENLDSRYLPLLTETVELWVILAEVGEVEEHQGYHLIASSLHWIFGASRSITEASNVRYRFMNLLVVTYTKMPRNGRYKAVHDLLNMMFRFNSTISDAVHLLLRLVAVTGSVPMSVWTEATSLRKRQVIESDAMLRHKEATALSQMISRRIIEFTFTNNEKTSGGGRDLMQGFLDECASALMSPQLPSTEILLSSFIATLFSLSETHRNRKYCLFSFSVLRLLQETLVRFRSRENVAGEVDPVSLISAVDSPEQANYLASRQCTLPSQPYFDLQLALAGPRTIQRSNYVTDSEWVSFLNQWPIASYYDIICAQILSFADRDDIPDTIQVELFKVLERIVVETPSQFNSRWLDRLSYASASVCEALVPIIAAAFRGLEPKPYGMLHKMGTRLAVPGVKPFKKRAIGLLSSLADFNNETYSIAWLYLLISLADPDPGVSETASDRATSMFFAALKDHGAVDERLSDALLAARSRAGENSYLVQDGLRRLVANISASKQGSQVRRLVSNLLENDDFELAALLVEADGTFMPLAKISTVFDEVKRSSPRHKAGLRMLHAAFKARPRIILSPVTANVMFSTLVTKMKTATEIEISYIGPILSELVALGGSQVQQDRTKKLEVLLDVSFEKLCQFESVPSDQPSRLAVFCQLIMICGCVRFWGHKQGLEKANNIVEKLVMFSRKTKAGGMLSQLIVRTVFSTAAEYRVLFNNHAVDEYLSSLQQGSPEFDCFMQLLFQYDWHEVGAEDQHAANGQDSFKSMIMGTNQREEVLATSSMLQKYLSHILQQADREQNVVALRIISKALDHYLVVVDRCLPLVVSLCFSSRLSVAQAALATYAKICSRWPSSVLTKFVPGLKRCSNDDELRVGPFVRVWQLAKGAQTQRNIKLLIEAVVSSLRHDCTDVYAKLVVCGLMQTPLDPKDAKLLKMGLMENVFSFSPRNKTHGAPHIARMILFHVFETWLTRRYGLANTKQIPEDVTENEALEYIDVGAILERFADDRAFAKRAFEELLDEQYMYGTKEMDELVYGTEHKGPPPTVPDAVNKKMRLSY